MKDFDYVKMHSTIKKNIVAVFTVLKIEIVVQYSSNTLQN
jgi:hypothetical protein